MEFLTPGETPAQLAQELEQFTRDHQWAESVWPFLLRVHPEEWVGIFGQKVVGHHPDYHTYLKIMQAEDMPPLRRVVTKHVTRKEPVPIILTETEEKPVLPTYRFGRLNRSPGFNWGFGPPFNI